MDAMLRLVFSTLMRGGIYRGMRKLGTPGIVVCVVIGVIGYLLTHR